MDPIALATMTSSLTVLGTKVVEGLASEASRTLWEAILKLFQWRESPPPDRLAPSIAEHLNAHPLQAKDVLQLLQQETSIVGHLVGRIDANKVVVVHTVHTINM